MSSAARSLDGSASLSDYGSMSSTRTLTALAMIALGLVAACGSTDAAPSGGGGPSASASESASSQSASASAGSGGSTPADWLAQTQSDAGGLTNVGSDLAEVLEQGKLTGACDAYFGGQTDRATMLRCGKWMYFYETFATSGAPAAILDFLVGKMPISVGAGMQKLGMIPDPYSQKSLPLGIAPTAPLGGKIAAYAFTCASCHFGRLPDGRYAVGAPNHDYEYGRQNLALALFPQAAGLGAPNADPDAMAAIQPMLDEVNNTPGLKLQLLAALVGLVGAQIPPVPPEVQHDYAHWKPGTMDFLIAPLPLDDGVHTISKISALWSVPTPDEVTSSGMAHGLLGWTGSVHSTMNFLKEFVSFGGGKPADWPEAKLSPLAAYIETLRAPENPSPPEASLVEEGRALFASKACTSCHDGPRGSGKRVYTFAEIGTDSELAKWLDPTLSGMACCNAPVEPGETPTHGVKSPRIVGTWAMKRFLHNGSVDSLEDLFCVSGPRGSNAEPAYGDGGHLFTCDGLTNADKTALIAYLRAR
jgi:hypothetical protein